jgi:hypothetical protein
MGAVLGSEQITGDDTRASAITSHARRITAGEAPVIHRTAAPMTRWEETEAWVEAYNTAANGAQASHGGTSAVDASTPSPRRPRNGTSVTTRSADELEVWAQAGIDDEIDEVEADPAGTRNDQLNKRALRCFRLALLAGYNLDDVFDALVDACRVNGLVGDDGIGSVRATLRSARRKAIEDGPCDGPDDNVVEVGAEVFDDDDESRTT